MNETEWFKRADKLKRQFDKINKEVQKAISSGKFRAIVFSTHKATKEIPKLINELESLTLPEDRQLKESWGYFTEALRSYVLACQHYYNGLLDENQADIDDGVEHMNEAVELLKKAQKVFDF
jgi:predicted aldo/keto reductase-like oxidoreductase